jgi:hypothetical protein
MTSETHREVARRRVFYIPGYDPIHPRRYRELYRTESAAQAEISDYEISIAPKSGGKDFGWTTNARIDDKETRAEIDVLVWSDIVRRSMGKSIPATYWQLLRTSWTYIRTGALRRLMWLRKGPVIAALYPVGMLILQAVLAKFAGLLAARLLGWGLAAGFEAVAGPIGRWVPTPPDAPPLDLSVLVFARIVLMWALGGFVFWRVLQWFKRRDGRFFAYYLMHDYAFSARWLGANPPELEARMAEFRATIAGALQDPVDEVLVVGHSSGAHLAVSILADMIRAGEVPKDGPALAFLSLGQVVPMVSFLPDAERLRADLHYLSQREELTWVDVTAPGDGCAFALCDPVAVSGVAPEAGKRWPLVLSAAFTQTLSPERWKALRWRFFRLHFQYLCAFDRPGDYDYFRITAGPRTLARRFEGRAPSKSRIDVPASKYTSMGHDADPAETALTA